MKTAQILASKDEVLPAAWTARLSALWDAMPPRPWRVVRSALRAELRRCEGGGAAGGDWNAVFASLEEECLAAASVAQVHAATLRRDPPWAGGDATSASRDVVIKVQVRPHSLAPIIAACFIEVASVKLFPPSDACSPAPLARHVSMAAWRG